MKHNKRFIGKIILAVGIVTAIAIIAYQHMFSKGDSSLFTASPTVTVETPEKVSKDNKESFSLDMQLSSLKEELYPAASFCISFDPSKLEFIGIEEGNVRITDANSSSGYQLPTWQVNVEKSNEIGQINVMYLDLTGGKYAFTQEALEDEGNVLFQLTFRLRGSARVGDIYELSIEDAVIAANNEKDSLSTAQKSLKAKNGRIVVGE